MIPASDLLSVYSENACSFLLVGRDGAMEGGECVSSELQKELQGGLPHSPPDGWPLLAHPPWLSSQDEKSMLLPYLGGFRHIFCSEVIECQILPGR